ncbi:MAG: hypothetical protein OXD43_02460 [Bacteroidetes bacterium]|nr:hypothetical protein [Bacteroidota bacterium]
MLRVTFIILAIAATAVTLLIEATQWWRYIPMAGLILIAIILLIYIPVSERADRKGKKDSSERPPERPSLEEDGIVDIRPITTKYDEIPPETDPVETDATPDLFFNTPRVETPTPQTKKKVRNPLEKHILVPVLRGMQAALDAHAVGLIQRTDEYNYRVWGTVGLDWKSLRGESFTLRHNLLQESEPAAIHAVGENGVPTSRLQYSRTPANITNLGIAAVGQTSYLLLADAADESGLSHPRAKELLEVFGKTLSLMLYKEDPNRPRREIIAEEMARARQQGTQLALAITVPQKADILTKSYGDVLSKTEKLFSECLQHAAPDSRVIKFGEITYGIFIDGQKEQLETWHKDIQIAIKNQGGLLTGGLYVGIARMTKKHKDPDDLRDEATRALVKAYEGPARTVIV